GGRRAARPHALVNRGPDRPGTAAAAGRRRPAGEAARRGTDHRGCMTPFSVLHVCMGNICRSPMAERLLHQAARERVGDKVDELLLSQSAGTGGWHEGDAMNPPAARELRRRGGADAGFTARKLRAEHVDSADLVLTATAEQVDYVLGLRPDAAGRTFVIGEFGRLPGAAD